MASGHQNLSGKLLLAHPTLMDGNFRRTIVYLVSHDEDTGALGFIINRPAHRAIADLQIGELPIDFLQSKIYLGGPVSPQNVILGALTWDALSEKLGLQYFTDGPKPFQLDPDRAITLIGYSGWSAGQLEREIQENAWIIVEADEDLLNADASTWKRLVARIHPNLRLLAELPDDPALN